MPQTVTGVWTMKKFIAGVVVGAVIASALPAYGAVTSLVGKKVAGESIVELNGETVGTAIIVDNKSYLPVRDTAEAFDATVTPSSGVISLTTTLTNDAVESELNTLRGNKLAIEKKIEKLQTSIESLEEVIIPRNEKWLAESKTDASRAQNQKVLDDSKQALADQKQQLADLQAQLEQINARIAELEG